MLFPSVIPRVAGLVDFGPVPGSHGGDAHYVADKEGRRWVRKREVDTGFQPLLGEAAGWLIGRRLGVPIPDGAACDLPSAERAWLSAQIQPVVHWDPGQVSKIDNLADLGAMLTLDVVIHNADRHAGNILLQPLDYLHIRAWAIDAGHALIGHANDYEANRGTIPSVANLARGLPLDVLAEGAHEGARVAAELTEKELQGFVLEACEIAQDNANASRILGVLRERCAVAPKLVASYLDEIGGLD